MKHIAVIGFGRFGELFAGLAKDSYEVMVHEADDSRRQYVTDLGYGRFAKLTFTTRTWTGLSEAADYSARDSRQLYEDMLAYNPFATEALEHFKHELEVVYGNAINLSGTKVQPN